MGSSRPITPLLSWAERQTRGDESQEEEPSAELPASEKSTYPERAPDEHPAVVRQRGCVTVPRRDLHHFFLQLHQPRRGLRPFCRGVAPQGAFIVAAKGVDLQAESETVRMGPGGATA